MDEAPAHDQLRQWLARQQQPTLDQLRAVVEAELTELSEVDRMLGEIHQRLGRHPERLRDVQELLEGLRSHRAQTVNQLGHAVASWVREGGQVVLEGPSSQERFTAGVTVPEASVPPTREQRSVAPPLPVETSEPSPASLPGKKGLLAELLGLIGPPRDLTDTLALLDEVEALEALCAPAALLRWVQLPKPAQRSLLAMAVARTRAQKDRPNLSPGVRNRLKAVIATFPAYAKQHSPGYVNGLQLGHEPTGISWRADGLAYWDELRRTT